MPKRRCLTCGVVGPWTAPRCPDHQAAFEAARERRPRRVAIKSSRYDSLHRKTRKAWLPYVIQGTVRCGRYRFGQCLHVHHSHIRPNEAWDLDHLPDGTRHPSHADCNRAARANPARKTA